MRSNRRILKSLAVMLLLVFCQKVGGGLYLHNWLHAKACTETSQSTETKVTGYNCSCIDDFSMPFADDAERTSQPTIPITTEFIVSYNSSIPHSSPFFHSLRAPPFFS
jgi:hypothetical protein